MYKINKNMQLDIIKNEIKATYPLVKLIDRKASLNYPRTLWLSIGHYKDCINNDNIMLDGYKNFKEVMNTIYQNTVNLKNSYK